MFIYLCSQNFKNLFSFHDFSKNPAHKIPRDQTSQDFYLNIVLAVTINIYVQKNPNIVALSENTTYKSLPAAL